MSCDTLANCLKENPASVAIVDIRDPVSFSQAHIDGTRHIDNNTVADYSASADFEKPLIFCCYHGNSSKGAAENCPPKIYLFAPKPLLRSPQAT